jgi:hypothetical protein
MPNVSDSLAINLAARLQQIHATATIRDQLNVSLFFFLGMVEVTVEAARPIENAVDEKRLGASACEE